jgi:hypothetical protein
MSILQIVQRDLVKSPQMGVQKNTMEKRMPLRIKMMLRGDECINKSSVLSSRGIAVVHAPWTFFELTLQYVL